MPTKPKTQNLQTKLFQIKVTLVDAPLPIWRRLEIPADLPLDVVHEILQVALGWFNTHLHEFESRGKRYGQMQFAEEDPKLLDETACALGDLVKKAGDRATYRYDFGDCWNHEIVLEKISIFNPEVLFLARCKAGKRACPPEDVGGVSGYRHFIDCIEDPESSERNELLEWIGSDFDPNSFDARNVNIQYQMLEQQMEEAAKQLE